MTTTPARPSSSLSGLRCRKDRRLGPEGVADAVRDAMETRIVLRRIVTRVRLRVERARLEYVFLLIALAWGVAQVFIVPPLQVPDEGDHWFRAWALTDGQLIADRQGMITLPGEFTRSVDLYTRLIGTVGALPISLEGQPGFAGYGDLFNGPGPSSDVRVVSRVASYGPLGYLPQAAGVGLGRLVGAPPLVCFYLARLGNLFASVVLLFFAIRLAPFGKQLFVLLALLPTTMFELASVSCDALTISGAMFFTSLLLWASARATLRRIELALVVLAAALFLNVKPGYEALVLLVLLVRPRQVGGRRRYLAFVAASTLVVVCIFLSTFWLTAIDARAPAVGGVQAQLLFILRQPMDFLGIVWANVSTQWTNWTSEGIGALGWLTITLPPVLYVVVLETGAAAFIFMGEDVEMRLGPRFLLVTVAVALFITVAVALYVSLEPMGSRRVFVQGRYLAPVGLLLLLSAYGIPLARRHRATPVLVGALLTVMVLNLQALIWAYHA